MLILSWLAITIVYGMLAALAPGLTVLALVGFGLGSGYRPSIAAAAGGALGYAATLAAVLFGYMPSDYLYLAFMLVAGVLLGYLVYRYWRASSSDVTVAGATIAGLGFLALFAITLSTPRTMVFFYASFATLGANTTGVFERILLPIAVAAAAMAVLVLYAVLVAWLRKFLSAKLASKRVYQAAAVLMAWTAVCVVVR